MRDELAEIEDKHSMTLGHWDEIDERRDAIQKLFDELKNSEVIKLIGEMTNDGFDPSRVLYRWVQSWC